MSRRVLTQPLGLTLLTLALAFALTPIQTLHLTLIYT